MTNKNLFIDMSENKNKLSKKMQSMLRKLKRQTLGSYGKKKFIEASAKQMSKNQTWPEREFEKMLNELDIKYEQQKIVGKKIFDFYIPGINCLVEVDGSYFHAENVEVKDMSKMQKRNVKNDKFKDNLAKGYGYKIERVWESDLKENYESVKQRFKELQII